MIGSKPRLLFGGYQSTNQKETQTILYKAQPDHITLLIESERNFPQNFTLSAVVVTISAQSLLKHQF